MLTKSKSENNQILRNLIPLTTLSKQRFEELCSSVEIEDAPKGAFVFRQGDSENEFVYLLSGEISLQSGNVEMDSVTGGSEASRFALAHQIPRKVDAVAKNKIQFVRIDSKLINQPSGKKKKEAAYQVNDIPKKSSSDWMTTLLQSPIFQHLPPSNLQTIMMDLEEVVVEEGEAVIRQGDVGDYYYIIKQGECVLSRKPSENAKEIKLAKLRTCDTFGEDALISGKPRNVSITMVTPGTILRLQKDKFLQFIKDPIIQYIDKTEIQQELNKGGMLIDVRSPDEYEQNHLPGSKSIPFFSLRMQINGFDNTRKTILVCEDGKTSEAAAFLLIRHSLEAVVVRGGLEGPTEKPEPDLAAESHSALELEEVTLNIEPPPSDEIELPHQDESQAQARQIIDSLKAQLSETNNHSKNFEKDAIALRLENSKLIEQFENLKQKATQLETELNYDTEHLETERAEKTKINEAFEALEAATKRDKSEFSEKLSEIQEQLSEQTSAATQLQEALNQANTVNDDLRQETRDLTLSIESLSKEHQEILEENSARQSSDSEKIAELESCVESKQQALIELEKKQIEDQNVASEKIPQLEKNLSDAVQQHSEHTSSLEKEIAELTDNLMKLEEASSERRETDSQNISRLEHDHTNLTKHHSEQCSELQQEIAGLHKTLEEVEQAAEARQSADSQRIEEVEAELESFQHSMSETSEHYSAEQSEAKEKISQLENAYDDLTQQHAEYTSELKQEIADLQSAIETREVALTDREQEYNQQQSVASEEISQLKQDNDQLIQAHSEFTLELEQEISRFSEQLRDKEDVEERLSEVEQSAIVKQDEQFAEADNLRTENTVIQSKLTEVTETLAEFESTCNRLTEENSDLLSRLEDQSANDAQLSEDFDDKETLIQHVNELEEKNTGYEKQVQELEGQTNELKSVIENFIEQAQGGGQNDEIASMNTELEMIREQAKSDFEAMMTQLNEAQNQVLEYKTALAEQKQQTLQLESELSHPLTVSTEYAPTDKDIFANARNPNPEEINQVKNKSEKKSGIRMTTITLAVSTLAAAGAFMMATDQGRQISQQITKMVKSEFQTASLDQDVSRIADAKPSQSTPEQQKAIESPVVAAENVDPESAVTGPQNNQSVPQSTDNIEILGSGEVLRSPEARDTALVEEKTRISDQIANEEILEVADDLFQ